MFCKPGFDFFNLVLEHTPGNYLEIGVFNGDSIGALARNYPNKIIYGIDPFIEDGCTVGHTGVNENEFMPVQKENTMRNIKGLENIVLFETFSDKFSDLVTDEMVSDMDISCVLIDGSHHYSDVINDVHLTMRLIGSRPGYVVFDDVNLSGVGQAHREFLGLYKDKIRYCEDLGVYVSVPGGIMAYKLNH